MESDILWTSHVLFKPNTVEAVYKIFYSVKLNLSSRTKIIKKFYCILF